METTLTKEAGVANDVLTQQHQAIKDCFRQFDESESDRQKKMIGDECLHEIEVAVALEEEIFYPAVRRYVGERQRVVQALAANQVAKLLIKELKTLPGGEQYNARFALLRDNLAHHFDTLQNEILPRVEKSSMDLDRLGQQMLTLKTRLSQNKNKTFTGRNVAAVVAGIAAIGAAVYFARRNSTGTRR